MRFGFKNVSLDQCFNYVVYDASFIGSYLFFFKKKLFQLNRCITQISQRPRLKKSGIMVYTVVAKMSLSLMSPMLLHQEADEF